MPTSTVGNAPGAKPPRRASACCIGTGLPISLAAPASARNSRWRENQATMIEASRPNRISQTITVAIVADAGRVALFTEQHLVDKEADHARKEHDEGIDHALDQRQRDHVAIGDVGDFVAQHGFDFFLIHALQQARGHGDQRRILEGAGGERIRLAIVDGNLGHADAGALGQAAHGI